MHLFCLFNVGLYSIQLLLGAIPAVVFSEFYIRLLGTNPFVSAPPAVPHSASLLWGVAGGLGAATPSEVPLTESPGKVLPMTQEEFPPPPSYLYVHVHVFRVLFFYLRFA